MQKIKNFLKSNKLNKFKKFYSNEPTNEPSKQSMFDKIKERNKILDDNIEYFHGTKGKKFQHAYYKYGSLYFELSVAIGSLYVLYKLYNGEEEILKDFVEAFMISCGLIFSSIFWPLVILMVPAYLFRKHYRKSNSDFI